MKSFGKQPARILAAGSFALAMTACQHQSTANNAGVPGTDPSTTQFLAKLIKNISKTIRGGFGKMVLPNPSSERREDDEDEGARE
jgi:hypothetical protein